MQTALLPQVEPAPNAVRRTPSRRPVATRPKIAHTAIPYVELGGGDIVAADGTHVANLLNVPGRRQRSVYEISATRAFIVRACNGHDGLVAVAKNFAAALEWQAKKYEREGDDEGARLARLNLNAIVLPAIAKAEGRA